MRERRLQRGVVIAIGLLLLITLRPRLAKPAPLPQGQPNLTNIFFLHHSTGDGIIVEGNMRAYFRDYNSTYGTNYQFWDHGYNEEGLRDPAGNRVGSYDIPNDDTDPPGLHYLWTTDNGARRQIMANHEVIAFKSCFPASYIPDEDTLNQYKSWYLEMRDYFDQHPEKLFVVMSPPPLHRLDTDPTAAQNARRFANWLKSNEYLGGHPNIVCFDLFNELAQPDDGTSTANMLRYEYELDHSGSDSHPNTLANQTVGPVFAQFLIDAARNYAALTPIPSPEQPIQVPTPLEPTPTPEEATRPPAPTPEQVTRPSPVVEIIVDNTDPSFAIEAGEWGTCQDGQCSGLCYGADFHFAEPGCSSCRARFDFTVPSAGEYDVWTWWPWGEDRATDTPFTIIYSGGPFTINVDQRNNGDAWWWLATLAFEAGESASIVVEGSGTGYANADAIALTPAGSGPPSGPGAEQPTVLPEVTEQLVQVPTPAVWTTEVPLTIGAEKVIGDIDAGMKVHLQSIIAIGQARGRRINVFAKIGDSITESMAFLNDYCCGWYDLGPHTELEEVIQYFATAHADELEAQVNPYHTSFDRMSLAAESGAYAAYMLEGGANSNLMQELNAIQPGLAIIMFGTNEALAGEDVATYKASLRQIVTILKEEGVIPILSTIPDLVPPAEGGERIPAFNQAIKEVAFEEQVPLMDYWQALQPLPNKGVDADGIHPNVFMEGGEYRSGDLTPEGLQYGFNVRNKLALEMLAKVKAIVMDDGPPDPGGPIGAVLPTEPPVVSPAEPPVVSPAEPPVVSPAEPPATDMPPVAGTIRPFPNTSDGIYVFNDQLAGWSMTEEQFQFAATHYVGCQKMTRDHTRHLRQYNPGFIVLHYRLGLGLGYQQPDAACQPNGNWLQIIEGDEWVQEWPGDEVVQDGWFFPWTGQPRVYNCDWGWYVMELNDPGWRAWWSNRVIGQMAANEADGLFADSFTVPNYLGADRYLPSLPAMDIAFEEAWAIRIEDFITYLQGQFGDYYLIPNVGQWVTTRDPTDYSAADGVMIEGFSEWEPQAPFELMDWQLQMNRILELTRQDRTIIAQSYLWDPGDVETRLFYLGNYLLIKGRHSYINIEYSMEPEYFPEYDLDLGQPLDPLLTEIDGYFNAGWGVYSRRYTNGLVLVNPGTSAHGIDLGGTYYLAQLSGGGLVPANGDISAWSVDYTPVTHLDLAPNHAAVLLSTVP